MRLHIKQAPRSHCKIASCTALFNKAARQLYVRGCSYAQTLLPLLHGSISACVRC